MEHAYKGSGKKTGVRFLDLTKGLGPDTPVFPGDPPVAIKVISVFPRVTEISFCTHSGTHMDAPSHFSPHGRKLSDYGVENFVGRGVAVDARGVKTIGREILQGKEIFQDDIVLFCTGWQEKYGQDEYFTDYPAVSGDLARELANLKIKMLGLDFPGPDTEPFLIHKILLKAEILILENLCNLEPLLEAKSFEITALPLKLAADGGPARVMAKIYE